MTGMKRSWSADALSPNSSFQEKGIKRKCDFKEETGEKGIKRKCAADALLPNTPFQAKKEIDPARGVENRDTPEEDSHVEVHTGQQYCLKVKVRIPVDQCPNYNFVGRLLGPKGSLLQQLQEATQTKMVIRGRGSIRDKKKEEELRKQVDPKYSHLHEDLHVEISVHAPPADAYRRMSSAIGEIRKILVSVCPFEERANNYNSYGESYGDYNSGNVASYYYYGQAGTGYADGYAGNNYKAVGPVRRTGGGRSRKASRIRIHSYAGSSRHGY